MSFRNTDVTDCREGISVRLDVSWGVSDCRLERVAGTALSVSTATGSVKNSRFYNNGKGIAVSCGRTPPAYPRIYDCVFRGNGTAVAVNVYTLLGSSVKVERNDVSDNAGAGLELLGPRIFLKDNVVRDNGGHGVYITEGAPDLGTPTDPGGNTFAGSKSGYDVYNASSENIPAYGDTWDPQSEAEMEGKTWQDVNVTRIYDHWDDPNVGYVMWSEPMSGVAPASLGQIKASFKDAPAPVQSKAGPSKSSR
ncbi:MAG: hypothetical protein GTN49_07400 [candidate division Zixibacteria bacterium]|nr:hypothetical protein [candidate division Zixibacteria bacterium]